MTPEQRDTQLINRVYGNIAMANPRVTREMVAEQLKIHRQNAVNDKRPRK